MIETSTEYTNIINNCSQFIIESCGLPIYKNMDKSYGVISKIKVRQKKSINEKFTMAYDEAFGVSDLYGRTLFTNGETSFSEDISDTQNVYCVFPTDGYSYIYNTKVQKSSEEVRQDAATD